MSAVDPGGAIGPSPHLLNNTLIELLHRAVRIHPRAENKSLYGKILAQVLAAQAKEHQAAQAAPPSNAPVPHGAVSEGDSGQLPPNWAEIARGNPPAPPFQGHEVAFSPLSKAVAGAAISALHGQPSQLPLQPVRVLHANTEMFPGAAGYPGGGAIPALGETVNPLPIVLREIIARLANPISNPALGHGPVTY